MQLSCAASPALEITAPVRVTPGPAAIGPLRVLLVEDNPEAAQLVQVLLAGQEGEEYCVEWTPNLLQAMTRLAQPGIEVVLLDPRVL